MIIETKDSDLFKEILNEGSMPDLLIHAFVNEYTPDQSSGVESFKEPSDKRYQPIRLDSRRWHYSPSEKNQATFNYDPIEFVFYSATHIYGFFFTCLSNSKCYWAELCNEKSGFQLKHGGSILVTPQVSLEGEDLTLEVID